MTTKPLGDAGRSANNMVPMFGSDELNCHADSLLDRMNASAETKPEGVVTG